MLFEERLIKYEYKLSDTDDQVIDYIKKNKPQVVRLSIHELAKKCFTVPNTITRLTKKLQYEGFSHLKLSLKEELNKNFSPSKNILSYILKTNELIDENIMNHVAKLFLKAKNIVCHGTGDPGLLSELMFNRFRKIDKAFIFHKNRSELLEEIDSNFGKSDVVFLISLSGETPQILEVAKFAKAKGITIVSLTNFSNNSLKNMADINLFCYAPKKKTGLHDLNHKSPVLFVIELLFEAYSREKIV